MSSNVLIRRNPIYYKCPSCDTYNTLHRSRNRKWDEFLISRITFLKKYRCRNCGWRGYLSTVTITWKSIRTLVLYLSLGVIAAYIVKEILKKFI